MDIEACNKFIDAITQLNTGDNVTRNKACNEALALIEEVEDKERQNYLRTNVVFHLIDLGHFKQVEQFIAEMAQSNQYRIRLEALHAKREMYKKQNNNNKIGTSIQEAIELAKSNQDKLMLTYEYLEYSKWLFINKLYDECLESICDSKNYAIETNNIKHQAVCEYYLGIVSYRKNLKDIALQQFRRASELAFAEHSQNIAIFSEIMRAKILLETGKYDFAEKCLNVWSSNFALML